MTYTINTKKDNFWQYYFFRKSKKKDTCKIIQFLSPPAAILKPYLKSKTFMACCYQTQLQASWTNFQIQYSIQELEGCLWHWKLRGSPAQNLQQ